MCAVLSGPHLQVFRQLHRTRPHEFGVHNLQTTFFLCHCSQLFTHRMASMGSWQWKIKGPVLEFVSNRAGISVNACTCCVLSGRIASTSCVFVRSTRHVVEAFSCSTIISQRSDSIDSRWTSSAPNPTDDVSLPIISSHLISSHLNWTHLGKDRCPVQFY